MFWGQEIGSRGAKGSTVKNSLPTPSSPGFLSQETNIPAFLRSFQKQVLASIHILVVVVLLPSPAARKPCWAWGVGWGRGPGLYCSLLPPHTPHSCTGQPAALHRPEGGFTQLPGGLDSGCPGHRHFPLRRESGLILRVFHSVSLLQGFWFCRAALPLPLLLASFPSGNEAAAYKQG